MRPLVVALLLCASPLLVAETAGFDHFSTGFDLRGGHARAACSDCHAGGGVSAPRRCADCHGAFAAARSTPQPSWHLNVTDRCESCHSETAWRAVPRVDHLETLGACSACHDGVSARGQHPLHLPTTADCGNCHRTRAFAGARFSHVGLNGTCMSCHNGVFARGQSVDHIPTTADCGTCHNTRSFR
ncbi:MAG: cytochrome c3 family protein [Pseudomonadota bacterium]